MNNDHADHGKQEEVRMKTLLIGDDKLRPVAYRPSLKQYCIDLWKRRYFIWEEAKGKSSSSNRDMLLGRVWTVLDPLLNGAMYGIIFGLMMKASRGIENYVGYLIIGLVFFGYLSAGLNGGSGLIQSSKSMINSFNFPRAALAFSVTARNFIANVRPAVVSIVFALLFQMHDIFHWSLITVVPLYVLMHVFACGLTLIVGRITAFIPDLRVLVRFVVRAWFYTSGVFFSIDRFATGPVSRAILTSNPAYQFLDAIRGAVLYGSFPSLRQWLYLFVVSVLLLGVGIVFFWRAEARYVNVR